DRRPAGQPWLTLRLPPRGILYLWKSLRGEVRDDRQSALRPRRRDPGRGQLERPADRVADRLVAGRAAAARPGPWPRPGRLLAGRRGGGRAVPGVAAGPRDRPRPGRPAGWAAGRGED